jgi:hypothetical protein
MEECNQILLFSIAETEIEAAAVMLESGDETTCRRADVVIWARRRR